MATIPNTTPINLPIAPKDSRNNFPTHFDYFGYGGYRVCQSLSDRDAIKSSRKIDGMLVYVIDENNTYILKSGSWELKSENLIFSDVSGTLQIQFVKQVKIDTTSGLSISSATSNEAIIGMQPHFNNISDQLGNINSASDSKTIQLKESNTIIPNASDGIKFNLNSYSYKSTSESTSHLVQHNFGTVNILVNIYKIVNTSLGPRYDYIMVPHSIININTVQITLSKAENLMVNIIPLN